MSQLKTANLKIRPIFLFAGLFAACWSGGLDTNDGNLFAQTESVTPAKLIKFEASSIVSESHTIGINSDDSAKTTNLNWPAVLTNDDAWLALPAADVGKGTPLPKWARIMARTLPYTTAAMIELEFLYRTEQLEIIPVIEENTPNISESRSNDRDSSKDNSLNAEAIIDGYMLASVARYSVAEFHRSNYGKRLAVADLVRRNRKVVADSLISDPSKLPPLALEVYQFANQMASLGSSLTDAKYQSLRNQVGDEAMVGLVLRIAQGCFQDRMFCALGIAEDADANDIPIEIHFVDSLPNGSNTPSANRSDDEKMLASVEADKSISAATAKQSSSKLDKVVDDKSGWDDLDADALQSRLTQQRDREPRIAVPEWDAISARIPKDLYRRPLRIRWSRVVVGYQPKLGPAWIKCLRVFEQEAHQNRVFEESVFWVVTRGLKCFYCMGHCEMLMEVGGLKRDGILDRTSRLASGDWSSFSNVEQVAFRFAKKLTVTPLEMSDEDRNAIYETLGDVRALDLVWWSSRCQFMTKVSDAFQLQLERDNVFAD